MRDKDPNTPSQRDMDVESAMREDFMAGKHSNGDWSVNRIIVMLLIYEVIIVTNLITSM